MARRFQYGLSGSSSPWPVSRFRRRNIAADCPVVRVDVEQIRESRAASHLERDRRLSVPSGPSERQRSLAVEVLADYRCPLRQASRFKHLQLAG